MSFAIMCDNTEIATFCNKDKADMHFILNPDVPVRYRPFGLFKDTNIEPAAKVFDWFKSRVFPRERVDCERLLEELGLERYDEWEILKKTRGTLMTDYFWLRVEDTDTYEKFSLRGAGGISPVDVRMVDE